jgi:hypothetical protein
MHDRPFDDLLDPFALRPLPLRTAMQLQMEALRLGLAAVERRD